MLVLTRKLSQQIKIGDNITLTVLRVKGNTVRLGIDAPRDVRVVRSELPAEGSGAVGEGQEAVASELTFEVEATTEDQQSAEQESADAAASDTPRSPLAPRLPLRKYSKSELPPLRHLCSASLGSLAK